ncbi:gonadal somatic cell derived factor [Eucyclogobius newberryi]|uniref:gonadal somatic cell derived factor n=1 Tax=Eucyclogobius newberryi TaxID=166745 RepID=UPI003B5B3D9B
MSCAFSMSCACVFVMILLGSSVVMAFVLQPSQEESDRAVISTGFHQSCHSVSLESIKKDILKSLNLQAEPQVPVGLLDTVQEQWKTAFGATSNEANGTEAASVSDGGMVGNALKCCSMTSEIFMKDLGWNNWVIYPSSLRMTECKLCIREVNTVQCLPHAHPQNGQVPCCGPTSHKMVPIVYMDEFGNVVISSVQLTQGCGCDIGSNHQPTNK